MIFSGSWARSRIELMFEFTMSVRREKMPMSMAPAVASIAVLHEPCQREAAGVDFLKPLISLVFRMSRLCRERGDSVVNFTNIWCNLPREMPNTGPDPTELPPLLGEAAVVPRHAGAGLEHRAARPAGAGRRRARHRQGADRGAPQLSLAALGPAVRQAELRGARREPARQRAVRPRDRRLHRRDAAAPQPLRARRWRHAVPRRDRQRLARGAGEDPARHRIRRRSSGSAATRRCRSMSGSSPRPMSICRRLPRPARSAPTCSTASPSTS